jgi:hypothetical protein
VSASGATAALAGLHRRLSVLAEDVERYAGGSQLAREVDLDARSFADDRFDGTQRGDAVVAQESAASGRRTAVL